MNCRPEKPKKPGPADIWVQIKNSDLKEFERKSELTRQIEKLPKETQYIVYNILERYLNDLEG